MNVFSGYAIDNRVRIKFTFTVHYTIFVAKKLFFSDYELDINHFPPRCDNTDTFLRVLRDTLHLRQRVLYLP